MCSSAQQCTSIMNNRRRFLQFMGLGNLHISGYYLHAVYTQDLF